MKITDDLRKSTEDDDGIFSELNQLTDSLKDLDERGLVLSLSAFSEDALGNLLKTFLLDVESSTQLLEGFNAPLGTFSSRIKANHALGLINQDQFKDFEHLRKIRNEFAHSWQSISLNKPSIASHIQAMNYSRIHQKFPRTNKDKLKTSISSLLVEIRSTDHQISERNNKLKATGAHLIRGYGGNFQSQIEQAKQEVVSILEKIETTKGEEKFFHKSRLNLISAQISVSINPKTENEKRELLDFKKEIRKATST